MDPSADEEFQDTAASGAAADITARLEAWTSPKLGTVRLTSPDAYEMERDPIAWLKRYEPDERMAVDDEDYDYQAMEMVQDTVAEEDDRLPLETPPKRSKTLHRANTPVISNARKEKAVRRLTATTPSTDRELPVNVQSPWVSEYQQEQEAVAMETSPGMGVTTGAIVIRSVPSAKSTHPDYRRYHDALLEYLKAKRRVVERIHLAQQESALAQESNVMDTTVDDLTSGMLIGWGAVAVDEKLLQEEMQAEMDFLRSLNAMCWDRAAMDMRDSARKEGNFWLLLCSLRELGLASFVWNDDEASEIQNKNALAVFMRNLAARVHSTPRELIQAAQSGADDGCPLILQRRQRILHWLERCFQKVLPAGITRPRQTNFLEHSQLFLSQGMPETDKDAEILRASLALILAGRLEDAEKLARESGVPWRAAQWSGEEPHGYKIEVNDETREVNREPVGNPRRPLWRRMMWMESEKLNNHDPAASDDEGAIAAILSNHLKDALANASLRSWEKGLYATFRSIIGRMEDELLHWHNNNRRQMCPPFPGTEFERKEREHLIASSDVASLNEAAVINMLASTPFEEMQSNDLVTQATASFLVGKGAITAFLEDSSRQMETLNDESSLRFVTHLALYMDSLSLCSTPIALDGTADWKNEVLLRYLQHLSSREDLWYMLVLYASLLPEPTQLQYLPRLLAPIESQEERKVIVRQLREFLPTSGLDLDILRGVVQLILQEEESSVSPDTPTRLDIRKMKAILWLALHDEHLTDALISANALLRQFLLSNKVASAFIFVEDILPDEIIQKALEGDEDMLALVDVSQLENARSEFVAFQSYLDAVKAVKQWREVIAETDAAPAAVDDTIDKSQLNATESAIADSMEHRVLIEEKRKSSEAVIAAADKARNALSSVLRHPGGWLLTDDEGVGGDDEEMARRSELQKLRVQLLPDVVVLFHEVCMETAAWMSTSLDDAVERLGGKTEAVLAQLDQSNEGPASPTSPQYWSRKALEVVQWVAADTYSIKSACGTAELKELLSKMAEATVCNLIYSAVDAENISAS